MGSFDRLKTVGFQQSMKSYALKIYESLFQGCKLEDLREKGVKVHVLDKEFGIDSLITLKSGQWVSIQEKYRQFVYFNNPKLRVAYICPDFTQEYKNASGTKYESPGEWFKLAAQLYFYGWANKNLIGFVDWFVLDVIKYKLLVEKKGGLDKIGILHRNNTHGSASFYAIPMISLKDAIIATSEKGWI